MEQDNDNNNKRESKLLKVLTQMAQQKPIQVKIRYSKKQLPNKKGQGVNNQNISNTTK